MNLNIRPIANNHFLIVGILKTMGKGQNKNGSILVSDTISEISGEICRKFRSHQIEKISKISNWKIRQCI